MTSQTNNWQGIRMNTNRIRSSRTGPKMQRWRLYGKAQTTIHPILLGAIIGVPSEAQLNENCTVSILNRNTQVDTNGNWRIDNVPSGFATRALATCVNNGSMQSGQSGLVAIAPFTLAGFDGTIQ